MDLFPACLSTEEKTKHWISMFSHFKPPHLKALKIILSQKRRCLQMDSLILLEVVFHDTF